MDKELQKYYEERFSMMATQGWRDLMEDIEKIKESVDHIGGIDNEKDLWFKKGELSIVTWLLNLKKTSEEVYEQLEAEDA